jgi:hypothetical protein
LFFGRYWGIAAGITLVLAVGIFCWKIRRDPAHTDRFKLASPLILATNLVISPVWHNYDAMFLLPAVLLIAEWRDEYARLEPVVRAVIGVAVAVLAWQWIAALLISLTAFASPGVAEELQIFPWLSVFAAPALSLVSLVFLARARLSGQAAGCLTDAKF